MSASRHGSSPSRLVLAAGDRGFRSREADPRVRAVAERLGGGAAAAAQREGPLRNLVGIAVPVDDRHVVAFHQVRPVLSDLDRSHPVTPFSAWLKESRRLTLFSSSCRAAIPSPRPATAG